MLELLGRFARGWGGLAFLPLVVATLIFTSLAPQ
jgi:hypothetical protein